MPKPSGYQSLHLTVKVEPPRIGPEAESASPVTKDAVEEATTAGPSVELQFRTQREHPPLMTSVLHASLQYSRDNYIGADWKRQYCWS
jgi:hypothetical protein